jgi:hypothetical protein
MQTRQCEINDYCAEMGIMNNSTQISHHREKLQGNMNKSYIIPGSGSPVVIKLRIVCLKKI